MKTQRLQLLTKKNVARQTQHCQRTVDYWMAQGWLPFLKFGRNVRFDPADVEKFIQQRRIGGAK